MAEVIVNVQQGKLRGRTGTDYAGRPFYSFQGIPYAKPPLGELRFKDPQPAEPWKGIRDATKEGSVSYQRNFQTGQIQGKEDCLFLNVYTSQISKGGDNTPKPVMFWIHGGGFFFGSGNSEDYGPEYLVAKDVVLVTINYRLGILGFLKLEDPSLEVPGNAGLKDMVQALHWVKSNIANFHGDPNNITIFGESAGSAAVHYLVVSPLAKGLFHRAIMQSGTVFNHWAKGYYNKEQCAQALNLQTADEKQILQTLRDLPVEKVFEFQDKLNDRILDGFRRPYGPTQERPSSNAFLVEDPRQIAKINEVPLLIGYTDAEGIFSVAYKRLANKDPIHDNFEAFVPHDFNLELGSEESKRIAQQIKEFYYKEKEPSLDTIEAFVNLESDIHFTHGVQKTLKHTLKKSQQPVFFYRFTFDGGIYFFERHPTIQTKGAGHGDELSYIFTQTRRSPAEPGSVVDSAIKRLTTIWTNFAKYGNPNSKENDGIVNVEWKPVAKDELNYVNIDKDLSIGVNPEAERIAFWDRLYESYPSAKYW